MLIIWLIQMCVLTLGYKNFKVDQCCKTMLQVDPKGGSGILVFVQYYSMGFCKVVWEASSLVTNGFFEEK